MEFDKIQKILEKYFLGESTLDEERELKKYFTEEKNIPSELTYAKEMFYHLKSSRKEYYQNRGRLFMKYLAIAASIVIVLGVLLLTKYSNLNNVSGKQVSQKNKTGSVQKIILSDNNIIWLNKNCEVTYPKKIKDRNNKIIVNGEAYFELLNNKSNYQIIANNILISAEISSSFNIKAQEDMPSTEITVDSGVVKVFENNNPNSFAVLVKAGYYCSVHKSQKFVFTSIIKNTNYMSWKTDEFKFDNTPIATVADILSEYYNVQIEFEKRQIAYCEFSGIFKKKSLDFILNDIKFQLNFKITSTGNVITLSGEECF